MHEVLDVILEKVNDQMNGQLCAPYIDKEIKTALFQMGPTKAPSLMDFWLCFTKCFGN
jgi:hypothetical protein